MVWFGDDAAYWNAYQNLSTPGVMKLSEPACTPFPATEKLATFRAPHQFLHILWCLDPVKPKVTKPSGHLVHVCRRWSARSLKVLEAQGLHVVAEEANLPGGHMTFVLGSQGAATLNKHCDLLFLFGSVMATFHRDKEGEADLHMEAMLADLAMEMLPTRVVSPKVHADAE